MFLKDVWHKSYAFLKQNLIPSDDKTDPINRKHWNCLETDSHPSGSQMYSTFGKRHYVGLLQMPCRRAQRDSTWLCIGLALIGNTLEVKVCQAFAASILQEEKIKKICMCDYWNWFLEVLRISCKVLMLPLFSVKTVNSNIAKDVNGN